MRSLDFSDDRLASILDYLSSDERWQALERDLSQHLIRVYDLHPSRVRVDSTTVNGYVHPSPDGWFQFGHGKNHRPDLPQVKIKLSALDPLGLPLGVTMVSGQWADDGLYVPAIQQAQQTLGQAGLLYVGDCKMAALPTRAYVQQSGDYYLCPLSGVQVSEAALAQTQQTTLQQRLAKAQAELARLPRNERKRGKKSLPQVSEMREVAEEIVHRYRVDGRLHVQYQERVVSLSVQVNADAVAQAESCLGWHVYVTNQPAQQLSLEQAVLAYREEYLIERGFRRLKGRPLSVSPLQLTSEQRVKGLLRLLSLGLRVLCLLEYQVRSQLAKQQQALAGLYAGNPKRTTRRPTSEALLKAFKGLYLTALTQQAHTVYHGTPLSTLQERIIALLGFPSALYATLALHSGKLTFKMSEP